MVSPPIVPFPPHPPLFPSFHEHEPWAVLIHPVTLFLKPAWSSKCQSPTSLPPLLLPRPQHLPFINDPCGWSRDLLGVALPEVRQARIPGHGPAVRSLSLLSLASPKNHASLSSATSWGSLLAFQWAHRSDTQGPERQMLCLQTFQEGFLFETIPRVFANAVHSAWVTPPYLLHLTSSYSSSPN